MVHFTTMTKYMNILQPIKITLLPDNQEFRSIPKMCDYIGRMCDQQCSEDRYTGQTPHHKLYCLPHSRILKKMKAFPSRFQINYIVSLSTTSKV